MTASEESRGTRRPAKISARPAAEIGSGYACRLLIAPTAWPCCKGSGTRSDAIGSTASAHLVPQPGSAGATLAACSSCRRAGQARLEAREAGSRHIYCLRRPAQARPRDRDSGGGGSQVATQPAALQGIAHANGLRAGRLRRLLASSSRPPAGFTKTSLTGSNDNLRLRIQAIAAA